ncbi:hypothetical protein AGLY_003805 [Aphis glycines]|uniref:Uncharacterized protein n=1 Tax=Aphis glycines TaxID=307491 RepID=A0A6G0U1R2_APHGL|nr:hypothetical protein AGLY_003805 [Aphis glycines]
MRFELTADLGHLRFYPKSIKEIIQNVSQRYFIIFKFQQYNSPTNYVYTSARVMHYKQAKCSESFDKLSKQELGPDLYPPRILRNSERSDEYIDFTMMCVFFLCACRQHLEHPSLKRKLNLVGTLGGQNVDKIFLALSKYLKIVYKINIKNCAFNLNSGVFRPLKYKPPISPTVRNSLNFKVIIIICRRNEIKSMTNYKLLEILKYVISNRKLTILHKYKKNKQLNNL